MKRLNLGMNAPLTGTIPTELGSMTSLELLNLSSNQIGGTVPTELGNISTLQEVLLGTNDLEGAVPAEVCAVFSNPELSFNTMVVDCGGDTPKITCNVPECCSSCTNAP
jgi:hypothetical protein